MAYRTQISLLCTLLVAGLTACADDAPASDTDAADSSGSDSNGSGSNGSDSNGSDSGSTVSGASDSATGGETETETGSVGGGTDLFACDIEPACPSIYDHLGPEPEEAIACAAELTAFHRPGVFISTQSIGPSPDETLRFSLVRADGTVIRQGATRPICGDPACPFEELEPVQVCTLDIDFELYAACVAGTGCGISWSVSDCAPLPDYGCTEAQIDLAAEAPTPVACEEDLCAPGQVCVRQTLECVCDPKTGEYDFSAGPTACAAIPAECKDLDGSGEYGCLSSALCEPAPLEEGSFSDGTLICGSTDLDCFGEC